ncbi:MAG: sigma-54-dependent Fis family transcriptional regulator [Deltaproteobacteria bacterium]|nr:sigma-54-dependent Fis family transcriptional regulator [Deltaproteobacteria bacterium]
MEFTILIVDDDAALLSVLRNSFREENYHVTISSNGLDAIEKCKANAYDLIITDIMMPGATGLEVLSAAKKINPNTLVILITGFASLETAVRAIREGAYDYITKPFRLEEIRIAVKNALENVHLLRENKRLMLELEEAYQQLHFVKRIMASHNALASKNSSLSSGIAHGKTLIGGDVLSHHLIGTKGMGEHTLISNLERLSHLKAKGLLSEKEFDLCKSKLLQDQK